MESQSTNLRAARQKLNDNQRAIVEAIEGPVMVIAGPGSGKTQVLTLRIAEIIEKTDTQANSILCLTFTDSATKNMRARLRSFIGVDAYKVAIHTFHSLGSEIINNHPEYFFAGGTFEAADELDIYEIFNEILTDLPGNPLAVSHPEQGYTYLNDIQSRIGDLKNAGITPEEYMAILDENEAFLSQINPVLSDFFDVPNVRSITKEHLGKLVDNLKKILSQYQSKQSKGAIFEDIYTVFYHHLETLLHEVIPGTMKVSQWRDSICGKDVHNKFQCKDWLQREKFRTVAHIYEEYQKKLYKRGLYDFDDMLLEVVQKLELYPDLQYTYQERFQYILIDEYQDTNGVQLRFAQALLNLEVYEGKPNIMVVGDDDQAIYKFQRATLENIELFQKTYQDVKIFSLNQNYRSRQEILDFAMQVIDHCGMRLAHQEGVNKVLQSMRTRD